jgi:putative glycosyltransferase (TIGR04372 family)
MNRKSDISTHYLSDEFTKHIGHIAVGVGIRAKMARLNRSIYQYEIIKDSNLSNCILLDYFDFPSRRVHTVDKKFLLRKHWRNVERIGAVSSTYGIQSLYQAISQTESVWEANRMPPLLKLEHNHCEIANSFLSSFGFSPTDKFVTIHVRDSPDIHTQGRNANIEEFVEVIRKITSSGKWVVRLGDQLMPKLRQIEGLIDLTQISSRPKEVDLFALATCEFMIGTQSGPSTVPQFFGRPVIWSNATALGIIPWFSRTLVLPKLIWDAKKKHKFEILELLDSKFSKSDEIPRLYRDRYKWVDNKAEDIIKAIDELLSNRTVQEQSLQQIFDENRRRIVDYRAPDISPSFLLKSLASDTRKNLR